MAATFKLFKSMLFLKKDGSAVGSRLIIERFYARIPPPEPFFKCSYPRYIVLRIIYKHTHLQSYTIFVNICYIRYEIVILLSFQKYIIMIQIQFFY